MADVANKLEVGAGLIVAESYELTSLLGKGGMGEVWVAKHLRLPKQVAIKFLQGPAASNQEVIARFRREAEISARLKHRNIVAIEDFNVMPDGTPYLVMEHLEGESMGDRLTRGALPLEEALIYAKEVAEALSLAHSQKVIHRDLKPENIFLCADPNHSGKHTAKILDFGISKMLGANTSLTQTSAVIGTPQYMSPEQARGLHEQIDGRTDQFALGVVLFEMLTGTPSFSGSTLPEIIHKVVYEQNPELPSEFPSALRDAVSKSMSKEPGQRFRSVTEFVAAAASQPGVENGLGDTIAASTLPPQELQPETKAAKSRAGTWTLVAVVLGAVAFGMWSWRSSRPLSQISLPDQDNPPKPPAPEPHPETVAAVSPMDAAIVRVSNPDATPKPDRLKPKAETDSKPAPEPAKPLTAGWKLLKAGDLDGAEAWARKRTKRRTAQGAFALLSAIACRRGDQISAFAWSKRVRKNKLRKRIKRVCKTSNIELD